MMVIIRLLLTAVLLMVATTSSLGQSEVDRSDPRQMALDVFSGIERSTEPATIALKLRQIIELFRYRCTRVTDYQIFAKRPNITDIKVKCSGDPLYGVTVATNGFVSVYGGNSILAGLDRRDSVIYSLDVDGEVDDTSGFDIDRIKEETQLRATLGSEYDYVYLGGMLIILLGIMFVMALVFFRVLRRKQGRKPRGRMKPMQKFKVGLTSEMKGRLVEESTEVAKFVYRHESGIFIAVGKRGKRRLFMSALWAKIYARWGIRMFEATTEQLDKLDLNLPEVAEMVDEGDEVALPR